MFDFSICFFAGVSQKMLRFNAEVCSVRRTGQSTTKEERGQDRCVLTIFGQKDRREVKLSEVQKIPQVVYGIQEKKGLQINVKFNDRL